MFAEICVCPSSGGDQLREGLWFKMCYIKVKILPYNLNVDYSDATTYHVNFVSFLTSFFYPVCVKLSRGYSVLLCSAAALGTGNG
jgi:hypothetical protein